MQNGCTVDAEPERAQLEADCFPDIFYPFILGFGHYCMIVLLPANMLLNPKPAHKELKFAPWQPNYVRSDIHMHSNGAGGKE